MLTKEELERYDRQIMIDGFGKNGQERLKQARVFIAGSGGLGSPAATYLTAAGVGRVRIVDHDSVELSNLNRQVLHWDSNIGERKVDSASRKLKELNPHVEIEVVDETIAEGNVSSLVADSDLIIDALDNLPTRYLLNRTALEKGIPFFYGAVSGLEGRAMNVIPGRTACLMCLYKGADIKGKFPVLGTTPALIACIQATEAIKYITGIGELLLDKLLLFDGLRMKLDEFSIKKDPACIDCGNRSIKNINRG